MTLTVVPGQSKGTCRSGLSQRGTLESASWVSNGHQHWNNRLQDAECRVLALCVDQEGDDDGEN